MDLEETRFHEAASKQGLSVRRQADDMWGVGAAVDASPLSQPPHEPLETLLSGGRVRLPDGRIFKRQMTTAELREFLGLEGP